MLLLGFCFWLLIETSGRDKATRLCQAASPGSSIGKAAVMGLAVGHWEPGTTCIFVYFGSCLDFLEGVWACCLPLPNMRMIVRCGSWKGLGCESLIGMNISCMFLSRSLACFCTAVEVHLQ
jgi:hypothetical protein